MANSPDQLPIPEAGDTPPTKEVSIQPARRTRGRRSAGSGAANQNDPGAELELRVARLEFAEGALARLRVPVRAEDADPGRSILTDIDVLAIDVDQRLRISRSSLECKSGKGESGEMDRLLWLSGFRQLLQLDRAVLVRPTVTRRGRALARRLNLHVLDLMTLERREAAHAWLPANFAHIGGTACISAEARTDVQLRGLTGIGAELVAFLRHHALLAEPYSLLGALDSLGRSVRRQGVLPEPAGIVISGHALVCLLLAALQDASHLDMVPTSILHQRHERALTVGSPDDDHILQILDRADALIRYNVDRVHKAYSASGIARQDVTVPGLREVIESPPRYLEHYVDLVERLRATPTVSHDLLQTAELVCFDALLGDHAWREPAFDHLFTAEHRGLLLSALQTLTAIVGDAVTHHLGSIVELRFDRASPPVPDRHQSSPDRGSRDEMLILADGQSLKRATLVEHPEFGTGKVTNVRTERSPTGKYLVEVVFRDSGAKWLSLDEIRSAGNH
jgi:hypothetical protein